MLLFLSKIINFLASLWCAVALIIVVGVVVAAGTMIESWHGADAAQLLVYKTPWFSVLLVLLSLNLLLSAMSRWPWKKKHIGFLTTHLGIILILVGSLITARFGIDGQIQITEGDTANRITLFKPVLEIIEPDSSKNWMLPVNPHPLVWEGYEAISSDKRIPFKMALTQEYPKAKAEEVIQEVPGASPAIQFRLKGMMGEFEEWLFLNDSERNSMSVGAATVRFSKEPIKLEIKKKKELEGALIFQFNSGTREEMSVRLDGKTKQFKLKEKGLKVSVDRILHDAIVEGNQLVDRSLDWKNPAIEFTLEVDQIKEEHVAFSNYPEFPTLHGMKPSAAGVQIQFKMSGLEENLGKNELRFVYRDGQLPAYQVKKGDVVTGGDVKLDEEISTGWMDFKFTATKYLNGAQVEQVFKPLSGSSDDGNIGRVIEIELVSEGRKERVWLVQGEVKNLSVGGRHFHMVYGLEAIPLGFNIKLKDFIMETDPGTEKPASFKSQVTVKDPMRGMDRDVTIQMNEPLHYRGYSVYQSAYHVTPGQPDISIFTVAKDPGIWVKYTGAIVMTLGMIFFFYVKELSTVKSTDPKMRKL